MMTKNSSTVKTWVRKSAILPLVFILTVTLTFSQENLSKENLVNFESEWWYPILKKHNIEPQAFNNFGNIFEMGSSNSINDRIVTLKDALFLIKTGNNEYSLVKSPLAYHHLDDNIIKGEVGTFETYSLTDNDPEPKEVMEMKHFELKIDHSSAKAD